MSSWPRSSRCCRAAIVDRGTRLVIIVRSSRASPTAIEPGSPGGTYRSSSVRGRRLKAPHAVQQRRDLGQRPGPAAGPGGCGRRHRRDGQRRLGCSQGGLSTKIHHTVDGWSTPSAVQVGPDRVGTRLCRHGIVAVIPEPRDQKGPRKRREHTQRATSRLRPRSRQGPQRRRTILQRPQAPARPGRTLRKTRHRLPRRRLLATIRTP